MYLMDKPSKWEDYLHLVEFAYNNKFQFSAGMSPFEILYGHKCNTLVSIKLSTYIYGSTHNSQNRSHNLLSN